MRYCFALDLQDDVSVIREYETWHQQVWPEVLTSIRKSGITSMEIYRVGNRLFMIMEAGPEFSLERKIKSDEMDARVQEWETLMWTYQQALPFARPGEKWILMKKVFSLD